MTRQSYNAIGFSVGNRNDKDSADNTIKLVLFEKFFLKRGAGPKMMGTEKGNFILFDHYFDEYMILSCGGEINLHAPL